MVSPRVSSIWEEMLEEQSDVNLRDLPTVLGSQSADKQYYDASLGSNPETASGHDPSHNPYLLDQHDGGATRRYYEQHGDTTSNDFMYTTLEGLPSHLKTKVLNILGKRNRDEDIEAALARGGQ